MMPPPFISYGPLIREAPGPSSVRQGLWHPTITSAGPNPCQSTYLLPYDYESKHVQDLTYCNNVHLSLSRWQMNDRRMSYPAAIPARVYAGSRESMLLPITRLLEPKIFSVGVVDSPPTLSDHKAEGAHDLGQGVADILHLLLPIDLEVTGARYLWCGRPKTFSTHCY